MTTHTAAAIPPPGRHFGLDWLRVSAFVLLIFYHIGMVFAPGAWMMKARHIVDAAGWPMVVIQPWRMPLLFAVSGYASHALLSKSQNIAAFAKLRTRRLLLPLLFGTLFVVSPQYWAKLSYEQGYTGGLLHFWWADWLSFDNQLGPWMPDTGHLWFIAYLWTYTMVLGLLVCCAGDRIREKLIAAAQWLGQGWRLLWVPLVPLLTLRLALLFTVPEVHGVVHDWVSDAVFLPPFLLGFALAATPGWWPSLTRIAIPAGVVGVISGAIVLAVEVSMPDGIVHRTHLIQALQREAALVMSWSMVLLLLDLANRWLNHDHKWRAPLCEAVFPFYIAHQTIIVFTAWAINVHHIGNGPAFAVLVVATFGGCWLFYRIAVVSGPLREWLGLNPKRKSAKAASS